MTNKQPAEHLQYVYVYYYFIHCGEQMLLFLCKYHNHFEETMGMQ